MHRLTCCFLFPLFLFVPPLKCFFRCSGSEAFCLCCALPSKLAAGNASVRPCASAGLPGGEQYLSGEGCVGAPLAMEAFHTIYSMVCVLQSLPETMEEGSKIPLFESNSPSRSSERVRRNKEEPTSNLYSAGLNHPSLNEILIYVQSEAALGFAFEFCGAQSSWHRFCCFKYLHPGLGLLTDLQQSLNLAAEFWVVIGMAVRAVGWGHLYVLGVELWPWQRPLAGAAAWLSAQGPSCWGNEIRTTSWAFLHSCGHPSSCNGQS